MRKSERAPARETAVPPESADQRRDKLVRGVHRLPRRQETPLFARAAKQWLAERVGLAESTKRAYTYYAFPRHKITLAGGRKPHVYAVELAKPMGEWKRAWGRATETAGLELRWHDLRHTFVTRLCESPRVSEQTIRSLAGHVSQQMLQRYSHVRNQAKLDAIAELERTLGGEEGYKNGHSRQKQPPLSRTDRRKTRGVASAP